MGFALWSCSLKEPKREPACAPCPAPFSENPEAADQVRETWLLAKPLLVETLLADTTRDLDLSCLCFGDGASTSIEGANLTLPATWTRNEQAARAAHLALHRAEPPWPDPAERTCDERVDHALRAEADGHALELETRRALRVAPARYPFEAEYFARPNAQRSHFLVEYFRTHPDGDGAVPGFAVQYRARCAAP